MGAEPAGRFDVQEREVQLAEQHHHRMQKLLLLNYCLASGFALVVVGLFSFTNPDAGGGPVRHGWPSK